MGAISVLLLAAACAGHGDGRPPGETVVLKPDAARLGISLPAFQNVPGRHTRYISTDNRYHEDFAEWKLDDNTIAGLTLSVATVGKPITDPPQPADILEIWPVFDDKHPSFGNPATTETALGAIAYRRVAIGTRACVLFIRRWTAAESRIATDGPATLSGYYCDPPGMLLPPDDALMAIRAVSLHPPRQQS